MKIRIFRVIIIVSALLEAPFVHGSRGNVEVEIILDPSRPHRPSSLNGGGIKGVANVDTLRSSSNPEKQLPRPEAAAHLRGARSIVGRVAEDDQLLRADNIFRSVVECDTFCNKPRRACGNRCRARITGCETQGIECHPWLCRAFCRGDRSTRYCQNRQIPSDECNRYRKGCSCQNYIGGAAETYDPVSGLTAFFDYSTNEVVVRWDKVQGPKLYDVRISKDNTKVKKLIARGSTKKVEAALFDLDATYDVAVRRKRGKMMGSSPYVSILYKHIVDESQMHKAQDDQVSTTEDHVGDITGNILINDTDPDFGHTLTVDLHRVSGPPGSRVTYSGDDLSMIITLANGSTLNLRTNGNYIFRRASGSYQDLSGTQSEYEEFKYAVDDDHGNSAEATLEVRVDGANDAPIALNDLFIHSSSDPTTIEDVADGCVLENDKDIDIGDVANLAVCVVDGVEIQNDIHQHVGLGQHTKLSVGADGCFTISGLATEYQYLPKGETEDVCFFYQACDGHQDISSSYKSNVAEVCLRVGGIYEGQDYCHLNNGGCDPLTECSSSPGGPVCGPCPSGNSGTGESGCMQNSQCDSFHVSVENDANHTTLLFQGWTNAQVSWEISLASEATKFEFNLPAMDDTEISILRESVGKLESTIADVNNTLTVPDVRVAPGSSCSKDSAKLKLTIPSSVTSFCFTDGCKPMLCRLPPLPSPLPYYTFVPSNNENLFGDSQNCTVLRPTFWTEWVEFHFGYGEEYLSDDFYYADPDNDGVMNILEYYGMGEAQLFSNTIDPADDEDDLCQQEDYNDVVFLGIQSATSYHAGVVELEWFPAFYNSTGEIAEGISYEIFVAQGDYDFSDLNGSLVCPPNITDLHRSFESGIDSKFYLSTNQTNIVIEGQPLGESLSIQVVAVADESSIRQRGLFLAALLPSFPVYTPNGFGIVVSPRDPSYASTYADIETAGRYKGPFYPSGECGGYYTDTDNDIEETLTINYYKVFAPGDVLVFSGIKEAELATWTLIESIKVGDVSSGILSGGGGLFQVEINEYFPEACENLQISTEGCIAFAVTPIDIDSIYDDLFYSKIDDVYVSSCIATGNYARRELGVQIYKELKVEKISHTQKYLNDLLTLRLTQWHHLYFGVEIDFKKSTGFHKATAAIEFSFNAESSVAFGPDAAKKVKTPKDLDPFWEFKKPIYKFFFINGYIPMWFHITPRVDIEGEITASAQFNMKAGLNLYYGKKLFIEYNKDLPDKWNAGVENAKSQKELEDEKLTFEAPEFKYDAALDASAEIKLVVPIEFYKVVKSTPLEVAVSLGLKITFDTEVEGTTEEVLLPARPVKLKKFDSKLALIGYLDGKIGNGVFDWKYTTKDEDGEDMDGKELVALKSDLQKALLHQEKCRWGGSPARCDAVIPIRATSSVVDEKLSFPNLLSMDESSEWYFDPDIGSSGWELAILTTSNEYNLDPHVSALLRKKDACKIGQVELPSGSIFFLSKPSFPSLPTSIPLFTVAEDALTGGVCSDYENTMNLPVAGTDPTSGSDAPLLPVTTVSVDSTIPCVAVIDEDSDFIINNQGIDQGTMWTRFREEYPTRPFCLLMPPSNNGEIVTVPENFKSDPYSKYSYDVSRDPSKSDDWFELCELSTYTSVGSIALFIDNSGSLKEKDVVGSHHRFRERLETLGINLIKVAVKNEVWIEPFLTTLSSGPPCITKSGATGRCLDKCEERGGVPVPWALGDPEPNCREYDYESGVVCCTFEGPPCLGSSGQFTLHLETKDLQHAQSNMDPLFRVFSTYGDGHLDFRLSALGESLPQRPTSTEGRDGKDYIISTGGIPCIDAMLEIEATGTDGWMIGGASIDDIALQSDIWLDGKTYDSSYQGYEYHDRWLLTTLFQEGTYNQIPPTKLDW